MATTEIAAAPSQNMIALKRAQAVRGAALAVKREIKDGLSIEAAINDPRAASLTAFEMLSAQPLWGEARVSDALRRAAVAPRKRVRDMPPRKRHDLAQACAARDWTPSAPAAPPKPRPGQPIVRELVGTYMRGDERRKVVLVVEAGGRVLYDRGTTGDRVIERFVATAGLLEIAAVAQGYLDERGGHYGC